MKTYRISLLIFSLLYGFYTMNAQIDTSTLQLERSLKYKYFVYLNDGKIIEGQSIVMKSPIFKPPFFSIDDNQTFKIGDVAFYQNSQGFFAQLSDGFAEREIDGRVNLYSIDRILPTANSSTGTVGEVSKKHYYYNSGFSELKKVNYRNLSFDLKGNHLAMQELHIYRQKGRLSNGLYIGAGVVAVAGLASFSNKLANYSKPNLEGADFILEISIFSSALITATVANIIRIRKNKHLKSAIHIYNR